MFVNRKVIGMLAFFGSLVIAACAFITGMPVLATDDSPIVCKINAWNFPDKNFREKVSGYDKDQNGYLSEQEIAAVTKMYCIDDDIESLEGIEYFTSLELLDCCMNKITSLDVSALKSLKKLACEDNELSKLDVSSNVALENLTCYKNHLSDLDISKNTNLIFLSCSENNLSAIDFSYNVKLQGVNCGYNNIKTLDFSNNPDLNSLDCRNCPIESLDFSNNPKFSDLNCSDNRIRVLDLSKNTNMFRLICKNNGMKELYLNSERLDFMACYGNKIASLDLSHCPRFLTLMGYAPRLTHQGEDATYDYYFEKGWTQFYFDRSTALLLEEPKPDKVTGLTAVGVGKNKVKLSWEEVEDADGYLIYAQKDSQYGFVGMTTSGTTFTDTKALDTDYNYYWVFAYYENHFDEKVCGGCEKYVYAKGVCAAVTGLLASSQQGYVRISWNAVSDADGYLIYGIRPGGEYGYIGMTTLGTSYKDRNASSDDWTFYWVFPYHKNGEKMIVGGTAAYVYGKSL